MRAEKEWLDPSGGERCGCSEANIESWGTDERRLARMLITARRNQRNRTDVVTAIRVGVNASVQARRDADEKCPGKRCKQKSRDKNTRASL